MRAARIIARALIAGGVVAQVGTALGQTIAIDLATPLRSRIAPLLSPAGVVAETLTIPDDLKGRIGELDYAVQAPQDGWYLVAGRSAGPANRLRIIVDPTGDEVLAPPPPPLSWKEGRFQAGWVHLSAGPHVVRVQNLFWTGFPDLQAMSLERARPDSNPMRLASPGSRVFRLGACDPLVVETGGNPNAFTIVASTARANGPTTHQTAIAPPSADVVRTRIDLPCAEAGDYAVEIRPSSTSTEPRSIRIGYTVTDTRPVAASFRRGRLVTDIRPAELAPPYASGETSIASSGGAAFRVSGPHGLTPFSRRRSPDQSWFAYTLAGLRPGTPHVVEIEYPDNQKRAFVAALKEQGTRDYGVGFGVNTGGEWPLSQAMQTAEALFWPVSPAPRLVLLPVHEGDTAAVARIRVFEAERSLSPDRAPAPGKRIFRVWGEEGLNFLDSVGLRDRGRLQEGIDRWLSSLDETGVTMVSPTVLIYNFVLYPSRYNVVFADEWGDTLEAMLLGAERYGMRVVPQLHPRADELALVEPGQDLRERLLLSREGKTNLFGPGGSQRNVPPHYDPFDPAVQDWYLNIVGELADRFRGFPSFAGIDLRIGPWQNPTFNNLASLDWGYDARSVRRFFADSGLAYPADLAAFADGDPAGAPARHARLVGQFRGAWIAWRCGQIARLFERIRDRVRAARQDLVVYATVADLGAPGRPGVAGLLEGGIDPGRLGAIDGVVLIDARTGYGRREATDFWARGERQRGLDARSYEPFRTSAHAPSTTTGMQYIEAVAQVAPLEALGLPARTPGPRISSSLEAPGRLPLERLASALGLADAAMLGWGGNGNARMPPVTRDFIATFTQLPAIPFRRLESAADSVAVWFSPGYAYAVNLQPFAVKTTLAVTPGATVARLGASRDWSRDAGGGLTLELEPFELAAFTLSPGAALLSAAAEVPTAIQLDYRSRLEGAANARRAACGGPNPPPERRGACEAFAAELARASKQLESGALFATRLVLESASFNNQVDAFAQPRDGALRLNDKP